MKRKMYKGGNSRNVPEIDVPAALNDGWTFERPSAAIAHPHNPQEKSKPPDVEAPTEPAPRKRRSSASESSLLE